MSRARVNRTQPMPRTRIAWVMLVDQSYAFCNALELVTNSYPVCARPDYKSGPRIIWDGLVIVSARVTWIISEVVHKYVVAHGAAGSHGRARIADKARRNSPIVGTGGLDISHFRAAVRAVDMQGKHHVSGPRFAERHLVVDSECECVLRNTRQPGPGHNRSAKQWNRHAVPAESR